MLPIRNRHTAKEEKKWCEIKECVKIFQVDTKQCSIEMAILNSEKVLFQAKSIQQNIKCHLIFLKVIIHNENMSHKFSCVK